LLCALTVTHVAGHLLVLEHLAWILALASRTMGTVGDGHTVRCAHTTEAPTLHGAGKAFTLRVAEFRVDNADGLLPVGASLSADHFVDGQLVDITGHTQGKGFAGAMKRWGFGGMRASHGVSITHRAHGSTGQRQDPGKVFKNKKMAGHMGDRQRTQQNLEIVRTDVARGLIFVKGSVPGAKNGWLLVRDAVKVPTPEAAPFPGALKNDNEAPVVEDVIINTEVEVADTPAVEAEAPAAEAAPAVEAPAADAGEEKKEG